MPATGNKSYHPLSLSIRIHADGFSFFVCDPQSSSLVRGEHFRRTESIPLAQQLTQELCRPDYFNRQMDQAYVLLCSPSIHVPLEEFRRDEAAALYNFTMTETNQDAVEVLIFKGKKMISINRFDLRGPMFNRIFRRKYEK